MIHAKPPAVRCRSKYNSMILSAYNWRWKTTIHEQSQNASRKKRSSIDIVTRLVNLHSPVAPMEHARFSINMIVALSMNPVLKPAEIFHRSVPDQVIVQQHRSDFRIHQGLLLLESNHHLDLEIPLHLQALSHCHLQSSHHRQFLKHHSATGW